MTKVLWIMGPEDQSFSGISKYSLVLIPELKRLSFDIDIAFGPPSMFMFRRIFFYMIMLPLKLMFVSCRYDKIVIYEEGLAFLSLFTPKRKIIIIVHDIRPDNFWPSPNLRVRFKKILWYLNKFNIKKVGICVVPSHVTLQSVTRFREKQTTLIPNAFSDCLFCEKARLSEIPSSALKLLYVGSEEPRKNFVDVLSLCRAFDAIGVRVELTKVGKPIDLCMREKHVNYIHNHNLNVRFEEGLSEEELVKLYRSADFLVFPSLFEGFGRPLIEAQIQRLPVVGSSTEIIREVCGSAVIDVDFKDEQGTVSKLMEIRSSEIMENIKALGFTNAERFKASKISLLFVKVLST